MEHPNSRAASSWSSLIVGLLLHGAVIALHYIILDSLGSSIVRVVCCLATINSGWVVVLLLFIIMTAIWRNSHWLPCHIYLTCTNIYTLSSIYHLVWHHTYTERNSHIITPNRIRGFKLVFQSQEHFISF